MSESQFPLQTLLDLAQGRTDDAAKQLGKLIAAETEDTKKLQLLQQYRADYQARFVAQARDGMRPEAWANYQRFLAKLDDAIVQQTRVCLMARNRTSAGQESWLEQRNRLKAFDTLSQKHENEEARRALRREQKLADEHAAKKYANMMETSITADGISLADKYRE